jgi:hypothetical protein
VQEKKTLRGESHIESYKGAVGTFPPPSLATVAVATLRELVEPAETPSCSTLAVLKKVGAEPIGSTDPAEIAEAQEWDRVLSLPTPPPRAQAERGRV